METPSRGHASRRSCCSIPCTVHGSRIWLLGTRTRVSGRRGPPRRSVLRESSAMRSLSSGRQLQQSVHSAVEIQDREQRRRRRSVRDPIRAQHVAGTRKHHLAQESKAVSPARQRAHARHELGPPFSSGSQVVCGRLVRPGRKFRSDALGDSRPEPRAREVKTMCTYRRHLPGNRQLHKPIEIGNRKS